jgi:hypothetical protein
MGHLPALPHRSIALRSTSANGHSARRGTAGLVGFMTIRSRWVQPVLRRHTIKHVLGCGRRVEERSADGSGELEHADSQRDDADSACEN